MAKKRGTFLKKLHVYGGLLLSFYVIILGISSLQFQHHFVEFEPAGEPVFWEQQVRISDLEDRNELKQAIRDSLELKGFLPWWKEYTDSTGVYHFMITRPGKQYWASVVPGNPVIQVKEQRMPFLNVALDLHWLTAGFEGISFARIWRVVSEIFNILLLVIVLLSVQLWYAQSFSRTTGWIISGGIASFSVIIIFIVWLAG